MREILPQGHRARAVTLIYAEPLTQPALMVAGTLLFYLADATRAANKFHFDGQHSNYKKAYGCPESPPGTPRPPPNRNSPSNISLTRPSRPSND